MAGSVRQLIASQHACSCHQVLTCLNLLLCRRSLALVSQRWNRVLYASPSVWRKFELEQPTVSLPPWRQTILDWQRAWSKERQREWLDVKLRQLQRVAPLVEEIEVAQQAALDTARTVEVLPGLLTSAAGCPLTSLNAWGLKEPVRADAMQALASPAQLRIVGLGCDRSLLPTNCG